MRCALALSAGVLALAACGNGGGDSASSAREAADTVPVIGAYADMPADRPFCTFNAPGDEAAYVLVTDIGDNAYHGYVSLDGEVTKLTEVETGFGAGMETRRFVNDVESVELEAILIDRGIAGGRAIYTGTVRVIYPVEDKAVKLEGWCRLTGANDE